MKLNLLFTLMVMSSISTTTWPKTTWPKIKSPQEYWDSYSDETKKNIKIGAATTGAVLGAAALGTAGYYGYDAYQNTNTFNELAPPVPPRDYFDELAPAVPPRDY